MAPSAAAATGGTARPTVSRVSTGSGSGSDDEVVASTTVTTTILSSADAAQRELGEYTAKAGGEKTTTTTVTHVGTKGLSHEVGKGGLVTLRPSQSSRAKRSGRKIRALVSFVPRESAFDRFHPHSSTDPFRGFYVLFWIALFILMLNTSYTSWASTGQVISMTFATLFSRDAWVLLLSDATLCASTFICVPFALVLKRGWVSYWPTLIWAQHAWQAALLFSVIRWTQYRDWPWVQSGFLTLHTLSMMMKIHSYMAVNGAMADNYHRMRRLEVQLEERVAEISDDKDAKLGAGQLVSDSAWAAAVRKALEAEQGDAVEHSKDWSRRDVQHGSNQLRHRTNTAHRRAAVLTDKEKPAATTEASAAGKEAKAGHHDGETTVRDPHPLASHPDSVVAQLARSIEELREEFLSAGPNEKGEHVSWPQNVTYANFFDYLCCPTLVYELTYPRVKNIRPSYLLEKALAGVGTFCVIYVITEHWIMPHQPGPDTPIIQTFLQLAVPMMVNYLLIFFVMFECALAFAGEATRFADREFYLDWWNSRSMDEFSRKWNKPVHSFLLRHVYAHSITAGASKKVAMLYTFLLSSLLHELVMAIVSGKIRGYLFALQMAQIPLIAISQIPWVKRNPTVGNMSFWVGLFIGFPMLNIGYILF